MSRIAKKAPPSLESLLAEEPTSEPTDAIHEELVGSWRMYQREGGHRASTDDVVTAWLATTLCEPRPARYLDLGCGIGSVLLLTAHALRPERSLGIEAQAESAFLATKSVAELPEDAPSIEIRRGDIRTVAREEVGEFDLVTGSPPYFPVGSGVLPIDSQRRACRFELRGGVEVYLEAASRVLAKEGRFALVFPSAGDARVLAAADAAGLFVVARADLLMRADRSAPFLTVYGFARAPGEITKHAFSIRDSHGAITKEYAEARAKLGLRA